MSYVKSLPEEVKWIAIQLFGTELFRRIVKLDGNDSFKKKEHK